MDLKPNSKLRLFLSLLNTAKIFKYTDIKFKTQHLAFKRAWRQILFSL